MMHGATMTSLCKHAALPCDRAPVKTPHGTVMRQCNSLLAAVLQSRTAKDVIRRLKYRFASEGQADVEEDPTCYDWVAAGDHCLHLFRSAVGEHKS